MCSFGFDDDFEESLKQASKQLSAICASDRLRLAVSVEDNADAADDIDDDGEDEEDTGSVD